MTRIASSVIVTNLGAVLFDLAKRRRNLLFSTALRPNQIWFCTAESHRGHSSLGANIDKL